MGSSRWESFRVCHFETDLWIAVSKEGYLPAAENYALKRIRYYRSVVESHFSLVPDFFSSYSPLEVPDNIHPLISDMYTASAKAGTGPMSAVAGAIAEYTCRDLLSEFGCAEVVVENGGDIFLKTDKPVIISVHAGSSPLSGKTGLKILPEQTPLAVCCSSGTKGHSISFGNADACVIACSSGALADAYATACCNMVRSAEMIGKVTEHALKIADIVAVVIIKDDVIGMGGKIEMKLL